MISATSNTLGLAIAVTLFYIVATLSRMMGMILAVLSIALILKAPLVLSVGSSRCNIVVNAIDRSLTNCVFLY